MLTREKALARLVGEPLAFGSERLIRAHRFLQDVQAAKEAMAACDCAPCHGCAGTGCCDARSVLDLCPICDGWGVAASCPHFSGIGGDATVEARRQIGGGYADPC